MRWILDSSVDIAGDRCQMQARTSFIRNVTGAAVTDWQNIIVNGKVDSRYLCCVSNDDVDGVFITAHISGVVYFCRLKQIQESRLIIANTCIWERGLHKKLRWRMRSNNPDIELYFGEQELIVDDSLLFRQSSTLRNVGEFGFRSSLSERKLFKNRHKGFEKALKESFERVPLILFAGE